MLLNGRSVPNIYLVHGNAPIDDTYDTYPFRPQVDPSNHHLHGSSGPPLTCVFLA